MKAITVRQPWAWAIIFAGKDIENRNWPTKFRGTIAIHAAKGMTIKEYEEAAKLFRNYYRKKIPDLKVITRGAVIGFVDIVDCVTNSKSKWFGGAYGFVLKNPRSIEPIYCSGALGFWQLPPKIEKEVINKVLGSNLHISIDNQ